MNVGIIRPLPASDSGEIAEASAQSLPFLQSWSWPSWQRGLAFPILFFIAYHFAMGLTSEIAAPLWFPDSILLCALLLSPRSTWWFYFLSALPLRIFTSVPPGAAWWFLAACYLNDSAKALLSAVLIQRFMGRKLRFDSLRHFFTYSLIAVVGAPLLSSVAGGATRYAIGNNFLASMRQWLLGDALAALLFTPMLLGLAAADWRKIVSAPRRFYWEVLGLAAGLGITGYLSLVNRMDESPFLVCLPMAFLLWAAVRFGTLGSTCSLSAISALAVFGIFAGGGPFVKLPLSSALQPLQLFLIVISFPLIALATVVQQQRNVAAALRVSEERLHQLSARLIDSLECERKLVSRQLHEDMAQRVAALGLGLSGLSQNSAVPEGLAVETVRLRQHAADIVQDLSLLSNRLGPPSLETLGLSLTLEALCAEANSHPDLSVTYEHVGPPDQLPWDIAVALYRVVQESLNNALAHSGASNISVVLFCSKETCQARISDDGSGFDLESAATYGFGIAGMNARMRGIGGSLVIHTWPGHGTEIIASIPSLSLCLAHAR